MHITGVLLVKIHPSSTPMEFKWVPEAASGFSGFQLGRHLRKIPLSPRLFQRLLRLEICETSGKSTLGPVGERNKALSRSGSSSWLLPQHARGRVVLPRYLRRSFFMHPFRADESYRFLCFFLQVDADQCRSCRKGMSSCGGCAKRAWAAPRYSPQARRCPGALPAEGGRLGRRHCLLLEELQVRR